MTRYRHYHENACPKSHENFIRHDCFESARKRYPWKDTQELINEAKKIERYVLDEPDCEVVYLKE